MKSLVFKSILVYKYLFGSVELDFGFRDGVLLVN